MYTSSNHLYAVALKFAKGMGSVAYKNCIDHFGKAKHVFNASATKKGKKATISIDFADLLAQEKTLLSTAQNFLATHAKKGIRVLAYGEDHYPMRLGQLHAPPSLVFDNIASNLDQPRVVSIVGTRNPSSYGKDVTRALVRKLKPYNPLIVSGLAYGIDIVAHEAALAHNMPTVAVMPGGHDMIYPANHALTAERMTQKGGGMLTEYCLGTKPSIHHFPARNRIIAGLADATIVVEAPKKSGALITAYHANEYNREVFAVPGGIHTENAAGCHHLIKEHVAHLMTDVEDLAYVMNWRSDTSTKNHHHAPPPVPLTTQEKAFVQALHDFDTPAHMEPLSSSLQLPTHRVASLALQLEIKGVIEVIGGAYRLKIR